MSRCEAVRTHDGHIAFVRFSSPPRRKCQWCSKDSVALCDEPIGGRATPGKTCDARMCGEHRARVGPNLDRCPLHRPLEPHQERLI